MTGDGVWHTAAVTRAFAAARVGGTFTEEEKGTHIFTHVIPGLANGVTIPLSPLDVFLRIEADCSVVSAYGNLPPAGKMMNRTLLTFFDRSGAKVPWNVEQVCPARFDDIGDIAVEDGNGNSLVLPPGSADYVIVGHGADGKGSFVAASGRPGGTPCAAAPGRDRQNCDRSDSLFVDAGYATAPGPLYFDDFVAFGADAATIDRVPLDEIAVATLTLESDTGQTTNPPDRELLIPLPAGASYIQVEADCHVLSGDADDAAFIDTGITFLADGVPTGFGTFAGCVIAPDNGNSGQTRFATPQTLDFVPVPAASTHVRVKASGKKGAPATRLRAAMRIVLLGQR